MGLYDYEQIITGNDPEGTTVTFGIDGTAPVDPIADSAIINDGWNTATYSWDATNVDLKVDGTITFSIVDVPGAEAVQTVPMESWFRPSINEVFDISGNEGVEYTATIVAASHEVQRNLVLTFDFPGNDVPAGFSFIDNGNQTADITWTPAGEVVQTTFDVIVTDTSAFIPGGLVPQNQVSLLIEAAGAPSAFAVSLGADDDLLSNPTGNTMSHSSLIGALPIYTDGTPDTWLWEYVEWSTDGSNWNVPDGSHRFILDDTALENPILTTIDYNGNSGLQYKIRLTATVSGNGDSDSDEWIGTVVLS